MTDFHVRNTLKTVNYIYLSVDYNIQHQNQIERYYVFDIKLCIVNIQIELYILQLHYNTNTRMSF